MAEEPVLAPALQPPSSTKGLRRCFICLTDELPSDPPSSWVDPCPCTLEAHQDCMLSWVTDCERSNKPLKCPVCKSVITTEGPWDPIVALHDMIQRRFTKASPFILLGGVTISAVASAELYGAVAMWAFAGGEALKQYVLATDFTLAHFRNFRLSFLKKGRVATLMTFGPTILFGHMLPGLSNTIFTYSASIWGFWHLMHDQNFVLSPRSPQFALTIFPTVRALYHNLYRDFVWPYEVNLNRRLAGLPPVEPQQNGEAARENRRNADRNGDGGVIGFLQNVLDALDPDDEEQGGIVAEVEINAGPAAADADQQPDLGEGAGEVANVEAELVFEVVIGDGEAENGEGDVVAEVNDEALPALEELPHHEPQVEPQLGAPAAQERGQDGEHEAPQAPPVRRAGIGTILSNVSNSIVGSLMLPVFSAVMGEALRLALPKSWTTPTGRRPDLLQQQWGRSLIGGCLFVVMKDAVRIYSKSRKVAAMSNRRVKNIDRRRGRN